MIRIGIVDDHPVFRLGLRRGLEREPDLEVVWDVGRGADALDALSASPVDVVLMDLNLGPGQDAFATIQAVRTVFKVRVVVVSASLEWEAAAAARTAGASGYLPKDLSVPDMIAAIRGLAADGLGGLGFGDLLAARPPTGPTWAQARRLTLREQQVLEELRRGHTNKEIARHLQVSTTTINKHVQQVLKKLEVRTRAQAVAKHHAETAARMLQRQGTGT